MKVRRRTGRETDAAFMGSCWELWNAVWPPKTAEKVVERENRISKEELPYCIYHYIEHQSGQLLALCRSFQREVRSVESGDRMWALALAGVCSRPACRGKGLGKAVALDAFSRLAEEPQLFSVSLFQTGVPEFYRKLGARTVGNRFINSLDPERPLENPWWDEWVMVLPAEANWFDGRVDLLGPGY